MSLTVSRKITTLDPMLSNPPPLNPSTSGERPVTPVTSDTQRPSQTVASETRLRVRAEENFRRDQLLAQLIPLPNSPRSDATQPLFQANIAPGTPLNTYFSENAVPMSSVLLNAATINGDSLEPKYIAQAALKANPDVQFIVPTQAAYQSATDPRFLAERQRIADRLEVPAAQVIPVRADMAAWPQDELLAGKDGIVKPGAASDRSNPSRPGKNPDAHWTYARRTLFGANEVAAELSLPMNKANAVARGGDTHIIQRPDGQQAAFFSAETVRYTAETHAIDPDTDAGYLRALGITMKDLRQAGVPLENIAPVGTSNKTYGQVLDALTPQERQGIDPQVMARFDEMRDLPFPKQAYRYHADVTLFTADGKNMFVSENVAAKNPDLERQLQFFGYQTQRLPGGTIDPRRGPGTLDGATFSDPLSTSYMNMVMGRDPKNGQSVILMPTQALDPNQLTPDDIRARDILQNAMPNAKIIPIGGRSALTGSGVVMNDGVRIDRDWGTHCLSNVLPYVISPR